MRSKILASCLVILLTCTVYIIRDRTYICCTLGGGSVLCT